jgi:tRNA G10  N-methylase Trm11
MGNQSIAKIVYIKRPFFLDRHTNPRISTATVDLAEMEEGRVA